MTPKQECLCRQILDGMLTIGLDDLFRNGAADLSSALDMCGLRKASINMVDKTVTGFTGEGVTAITELAEDFRLQLSMNRLHVSNATLAKFIADEVMREWTGLNLSSLANRDFDFLQDVVEKWFRAPTEVREHIVPCIIFPCLVRRFSVGPVIFRHLSELQADGFEGTPKESMLRKNFSTLNKFANERGARWLAFVKVPGRPPKEATAAADISTDIALAAIQLCSFDTSMRRISRASARAAPIYRVDVSRAEEGGWREGICNMSPALAMSSGDIEVWLNKVEPQLRSMGQRLTAFLDASSPVPDLDEAWCNAAYWYHEAVAETLDTVAVAKLETAIEVLLRAESMSGSTRRLLAALNVFFALESTDVIPNRSSVTVKQFVDAITTARSRVFHGTWPTLEFGLPAGKCSHKISYNDVEFLTRMLLLHFSISLDGYISTENPTDKTEDFFKWVKAQRSAQSENAAATPAES